MVACYRAAGTTPVVWDIREPFDIGCDVTDPGSVDEALARTIEHAGVPEQLTITAGVGHSGLLLDEPLASWDRIMSINARGPLVVMRAVARSMIDAGTTGSIVATSSISAHLADRSMGLYCASKAALNMLVRVAACEWAPHGIRVNAVGPGVTVTPMLGGAPLDAGWLASVRDRTALGRIGHPVDIAQGILSLHSLEWVTGQILDCDGGLSLHSPIDAFGEARRSYVDESEGERHA